MRVVVASESAEQREQLRTLVLGAGLECGAGDCVPFAGMEPRLAHVGADLVLIHVSDSGASLSAIHQASGRAGAPVLAVGRSHDPQLIIQALRSGAREFLDEERLRDELPAALDKLRQSGVMKFKRGRTLAITAASPGSGVTTVATNLAFALAVKYPKQVVLAELGTDVPELALDLDLRPQHTLVELVRDWDRMDHAMVKQTLSEHEAGVGVLAYSPETLASAPVEPPAMRHTVLLLRTLYDQTVLDLGHSVNPAALEAMALADSVVVVTRMDIPALRLCRRYLKQLGDHGIPPTRLRPVANRYGQRKQIDWRKAEEALGMPVAAWLPDDPAVLNAARNNGQPLIQVARRATLTRRIDQLAHQLNGQVT